MTSEWMKVMLEEISRKKAEAAQASVEEQTRHDEQVSRGEQGRSGEQERNDGQGRSDEPIAPRSGADRARG
jgi:hypothetical protein